MEKSDTWVRIFFRIIIGGFTAAAVWYVGLLLIFGPAQQILANPEYQSQKFLAAFTQMEPLPKMVVQPGAFYTGFLIVGILFSVACHLLNQWLPGTRLRRGLLFGFIAWLLMNPWFEFYLPWNVMHEPLLLALLESVLWLILLLIVGLISVFSHEFLKSRNL